MPVGFTLFEKLFIQRMNKGPAPMLDIVAHMGFKAIIIARKLGIFAALASSPATLGELAKKTGTATVGLDYLLRTLVPLGYIKRKKDRYCLTRMTDRWLTPRSGENLSGLFDMFEDMTCRWDYLEEAIRTGKAAFEVSEWLKERPKGFEHYYEGLASVANILLPEILSKVKVPAAYRRLIDLGGGHGIYAAGFCSKYPGLKAEIFDSADSHDAAEKTIATKSLAGRLTFHAGNFITDNIGNNHDIALLFNVTHILPREILTPLLKKIRESVNPGGQIVILDQFEGGPASNFIRANYSLINLELYNGFARPLYSAAEIRLMLSETGWVKTRQTSLLRSGGQGLITASRL